MCIRDSYNSQYNTVGPQMVKTGEIDQADIGSDILDSWLLDPNTADLVSKYRAKVDYSYFYCFNFNPTFDAEYEPENWRLAVNNENFRQSLMAGLDRVRELSVLDPNDPQSLAINSVTPPGFTNADGKEYTQFGDLAAIMARDLSLIHICQGRLLPVGQLHPPGLEPLCSGHRPPRPGRGPGVQDLRPALGAHRRAPRHHSGLGLPCLLYTSRCV